MKFNSFKLRDAIAAENSKHTQDDWIPENQAFDFFPFTPEQLSYPERCTGCLEKGFDLYRQMPALQTIAVRPQVTSESRDIPTLLREDSVLNCLITYHKTAVQELSKNKKIPDSIRVTFKNHLDQLEQQIVAERNKIHSSMLAHLSGESDPRNHAFYRYFVLTITLYGNEENNRSLSTSDWSETQAREVAQKTEKRLWNYDKFMIPMATSQSVPVKPPFYIRWSQWLNRDLVQTSKNKTLETLRKFCLKPEDPIYGILPVKHQSEHNKGFFLKLLAWLFSGITTRWELFKAPETQYLLRAFNSLPTCKITSISDLGNTEFHRLTQLFSSLLQNIEKELSRMETLLSRFSGLSRLFHGKTLSLITQYQTQLTRMKGHIASQQCQILEEIAQTLVKVDHSPKLSNNGQLLLKQFMLSAKELSEKSGDRKKIKEVLEPLEKWLEHNDYSDPVNEVGDAGKEIVNEEGGDSRVFDGCEIELARRLNGLLKGDTIPEPIVKAILLAEQRGSKLIGRMLLDLRTQSLPRLNELLSEQSWRMPIEEMHLHFSRLNSFLMFLPRKTRESVETKEAITLYLENYLFFCSRCLDDDFESDLMSEVFKGVLLKVNILVHLARADSMWLCRGFDTLTEHLDQNDGSLFQIKADSMASVLREHREEPERGSMSHTEVNKLREEIHDVLRA